MTIWDEYPPDYRLPEVQYIQAAVDAGECVSIVGLSGAGKSNLFGYLVHRANLKGHFIMVDGNRLTDFSSQEFLRLARRALGSLVPGADELEELETAIEKHLIQSTVNLCLLLDRTDILPQDEVQVLSGCLRALRDRFKYQLALVTGTRRPLNASTELSELFYAHTLWLGPLRDSDALWSAKWYARRRRLSWDESVLRRLVELSWGYPSLLRACCEAYASGAVLEIDVLRSHPVIQHRLQEFWSDQPTPDDLRKSGLAGNPFLDYSPSPVEPDTTRLTTLENLLFGYLRTHPGKVCEKDELIRAVWPEDKVFEVGVRDDSLAQLVRRLRAKIEPDPDHPRLVISIPGRGYRYLP